MVLTSSRCHLCLLKSLSRRYLRTWKQSRVKPTGTWLRATSAVNLTIVFDEILGTLIKYRATLLIRTDLCACQQNGWNAQLRSLRKLWLEGRSSEDSRSMSRTPCRSRLSFPVCPSTTRRLPANGHMVHIGVQCNTPSKQCCTGCTRWTQCNIATAPNDYSDLRGCSELTCNLDNCVQRNNQWEQQCRPVAESH